MTRTLTSRELEARSGAGWAWGPPASCQALLGRDGKRSRAPSGPPALLQSARNFASTRSERSLRHALPAKEHLDV